MCSLAKSLAAQLRAGDCIALSGDVGSGKSTFARAAIQALASVDDVPSPTFTLVQHYDAAAGAVAHFDLYRLKSPEEIFELGFEEAASGIVLVEWPERAHALLPRRRLTIELAASQNGAARRLRFSGADWQERLSSLAQKDLALKAFLNAEGWGHADRQPMAGDFSARCYARLKRDGKNPARALAMMMPDAAALKPFLTMQNLLSSHGLSVPQVYAKDEPHGLALIEDLGDMRLDTILDAGQDAAPLYTACMDALLSLHRRASAADAALWGVPLFDRMRFLEQVCLFLDVYGPLVLGQKWGEDARQSFERAWNAALETACQSTQSLLLRDCHAANIMMRENKTGAYEPVFIDFQDGGVGPVAYDIASLLEDARRDVDESLRAKMIAHYLEGNKLVSPHEFQQSYAVLAAQRHMRVLAITARRWLKEGAPEAQDFFKRTWGLFLKHHQEPLLRQVYTWLDAHVPHDKREGYMP